MDALRVLGEFGYWIFFVAAVAECLALPIAAVPVLLLGGTLVAWGHLSWLPLLAAVTVGAVLGDSVWYWIGRRRGSAVVSWACRFSLNRDACVSKAKGAFSRVGPLAVLLAKFLPGLGALAAPTAGTAGISFGYFLLLDVAAAAVWAAIWTGLGYALGGSISGWTSGLVALNRFMFLAVPLAIVGMAGYRVVRRAAERRRGDVRRLTPAEVEGYRTHERVMIVDVRSPFDYERSDERIVGAARIPPDHVEDHLERLPRDVLLALYCT